MRYLTLAALFCVLPFADCSTTQRVGTQEVEIQIEWRTAEPDQQRKPKQQPPRRPPGPHDWPK